MNIVSPEKILVNIDANSIHVVVIIFLPLIFLNCFPLYFLKSWFSFLEHEKQVLCCHI